MLQLAQRFCLDLTDALARYRELLADLFQGVILVHADAEAHSKNTLLARGKRGEHPRRRFAQVRLDSRVARQDRILVLDEVAEVRVLFVADRRLERKWFLGDPLRFAHPLKRDAKFLGDFLGRWFAADLVEQLPARAHDLVDGLSHMHRYTNRTRLI